MPSSPSPRASSTYEQLSPHFNRKEFRCHGAEKGYNCCGGSAPISPVLINALEQLRSLLPSDQSIHINRGFSCLIYNHILGSNDTSQHVRGEASDLYCPDGMTVDEFARLAELVPAFQKGGIGKYYSKKFLHVDIRQDGPARWSEQ